MLSVSAPSSYSTDTLPLTTLFYFTNSPGMRSGSPGCRGNSDLETVNPIPLIRTCWVRVL